MIFLNVRARFCCHIDLLTHREAVTGYPAGHRLASFYPLTWRLENLYLCVGTLKAKEYHHNLILIPIHMSQDTTSQTSPLPASEEIRISSVSEFIEKIVQRGKEAGTETFYRGHSNANWKLVPSLFRKSNGVEKEHLLFRDMVAHEPQSFSECKSALDYLVQMQHYGLPTRLLDVTLNPLVALYFACEKEENKDGKVYLFSVPENKVKHYDSDTISVLANLAKCDLAKCNPTDDYVEDDLTLSLYPTKDLEGGASFYEGLKERSRGGLQSWKKHEAVCIARKLRHALGKNPKDADVLKFSNFFLSQWLVENSSDPFSEEFLKRKDPYQGGRCWTDQLWQSVITNSPVHKANSPYLKWFNEQPDITLLLHQIRGEKPHFRSVIQPYELVGMFFVKAKYGNQRIANQMGAFLLFGLGLHAQGRGDGTWGPLCCRKNIYAEVPRQWVKKKLIIPKVEKKKIREELANLGITESYIYPGIEQYAKELKKKYKL